MFCSGVFCAIPPAITWSLSHETVLHMLNSPSPPGSASQPMNMLKLFGKRYPYFDLIQVLEDWDIVRMNWASA